MTNRIASTVSFNQHSSVSRMEGRKPGDLFFKKHRQRLRVNNQKPWKKTWNKKKTGILGYCARSATRHSKRLATRRRRRHVPLMLQHNVVILETLIVLTHLTQPIKILQPTNHKVAVVSSSLTKCNRAIRWQPTSGQSSCRLVNLQSWQLA